MEAKLESYRHKPRKLGTTRAGRDKEGLSLSFERETERETESSPADTLIWDFWDCERINLCYFKAPHLW